MKKLDNTNAATGDILQKRCSQKFRKFHKKTPVLESLLYLLRKIKPHREISYLQRNRFILYN